MSVETDKGEIASLAFGEILTAEEPVWVWDIEARRILWANRAGRAFWGAETLDSLRARRFDPRNKMVMRLASRAGDGARAREWTDRLSFPGSAGKAPVNCTLQTMEVAGGRRGLIVRAIDASPSHDTPNPQGRPAAAAEASPADSSALKAIAAQMEKAQGGKRKAGASSPRQGAAVTLPSAPAAAEMPAQAGGLSPALLRELSHELRNPLTVILGFAERIRDSDPVRARGKIKAYAENILEGAQLALEILTDFSNHLRDGGAPPALKPVDVGAVVASSLRLIAPLAKQAGMNVSKSVGRNLPRLHMEERALKQILLNVLVNAVRHQKTGGRIVVTARMRRDRTLLLALSDDGVGMTRKEIKAALGGKPPSKPTSGSGLGLPLVKRLVEGAGGIIAIESARRKGTTIAMTFPPASLSIIAKGGLPGPARSDA